MNEDMILEDQNIEDINIEVKENLEELLKNNELDIDVPEMEETKTIDESFENSIDELENPVEEELNMDLPEVEEDKEILQEDETVDDLDITEDEEKVSVLEEDTLETEEVEVQEEITIEQTDLVIEEESIEDENMNTEEVVEDQTDESAIQDEQVEEDIKEEVLPKVEMDENLITNDLNNIKIEFGIEAKGFILSVNMMEVMIQKGYIFKDMLNDKVFDAVMIFNGNLENTVVTNDIKIKIEDGKIQLVKS